MPLSAHESRSCQPMRIQPPVNVAVGTDGYGKTGTKSLCLVLPPPCGEGRGGGAFTSMTPAPLAHPTLRASLASLPVKGRESKCYLEIGLYLVRCGSTASALPLLKPLRRNSCDGGLHSISAMSSNHVNKWYQTSRVASPLIRRPLLYERFNDALIAFQ